MGGSRFAHYGHIESTAAPIFKQLAEEKTLAGLAPNTLIRRAGAVHSVKATAGASREFISHVAQANGYYVAWENVSQPNMLEASIRSFNGDTSQLARLIRENLSTLDDQRERLDCRDALRDQKQTGQG